LKFNFLSSIGKGTFGLVREAIEIGTNNRYAIKTLLKSQHEGERTEFLKKEVEILRELKDENPHIISCYNVYEDRNSVHIIFDLIEGGDLFDYISDSTDNNNYLTEKQAVGFFVQILDALHFLYTKRIVHRDIKLENFLIIQKDKEILLKLIDFGFASKIPQCGFLTEPIGSPYNVAPEILLGKPYDSKVDIWAAGVLLYNMVSGKQPFSGDSEEELAEKIINNEVQFIDEVYVYIIIQVSRS
jgi:calcium-dependent protein kinase